MVAAGDDWAVGEMHEGGQKVQTSGYTINKSWDAPYSLVTRVKSAVVKVSKRSDFKSSHKKKNMCDRVW